MIDKIIKNIEKVFKYETNEKIKICNSLIDQLASTNDSKIKEKILFIIYKLSEKKEVIKNIRLDFLVKLIYMYAKGSSFYNEKYHDKKSLIYLLYILAYSGKEKFNNIINLFAYEEDVIIRREVLNAGRIFALRYEKKKIDIISEIREIIENRESSDLYSLDMTLRYHIFSNDELKTVCGVLEDYLKKEKDEEKIEGMIYLLNFLSLEKEATEFINMDFLISKVSDCNLQGAAYVLEIIGDTYNLKYLPFLENCSNSTEYIIKEAANEAIRMIKDENLEDR
ncbi:hypothetical protein NK213_17035 [Sebaldella sp. S0638]|nr:hypothetical protein [Sebaldella sp. S0638]